MDYQFDLGTYGRTITTDSAETQRWFGRGLNWSYGFHHDEARRCYKRAAEADPNCAMAYWGQAYAIGPYYNLTWPEYSPEGRKRALQKTHALAQKALLLSAEADPIERALIAALAARFPSPDEADDTVYAQWDDSYADAMRAVYEQFPHDLDVCALTVEALICRTPWQLWDLQNERPADGSSTAEAIEIVETALAHVSSTGGQPHPGLLHFYIHMMEMSPYPERALSACDQLMTLVPDSGHLVHMPSHIYVLCGLYDKSYRSNDLAGVADYKWDAYDDSLGMYTIYRLHNVHFKIYSALFLGQYQRALDSAEEIIRIIPPEGLRSEHDYIVNYLEAFSGMKPHVYVRFGKWQAIIDEPLPDDPDLYCVTTAMWHYAKGVAYAATGDVASASGQQKHFLQAVENVPAERRIFNNLCVEILKVGEEMLAGELAYRREHYDEAFAHLRQSVAYYDKLSYTEPWPWMQPPRHALGALLMEQGRAEEAFAVYQADLGLDKTLVRPSQHPDNVWSLHGYAECLEALGQHDAAKPVREKLARVAALADVPITASCFCRQSGHCC